jgi:hypothetical protein
MDPSLILAGGLASLAFKSGVGCFNRHKKMKKIFKMRLSSLIMSKGTGKTYLKKTLQSLSSDLIIVDMNEVVKNADDELDFLKKGKSYVDALIKEFKKKRFSLLVDNKEQSEYFNVSDDSSFVITPCVKLFNEIIGDIEDVNKRLSIEKERLALIKDTNSDKLNIFESYSDLYNVLKRLYKLQSTF